MNARYTLIIAALAAAALPVAAAAQGPRALTRPDAEFAEPFTNVSGVRELSNGRVVVIDSRDKVVQVVDFATGAATKVGREGSGPGEYGLPMRIVPLQGDTSAVYDMFNSRLMVVLPDGKPGNFITIAQPPTVGGPAGAGMRVGGAVPRYSDARGRLYWTGAAFVMSEGAPPKPADSVPILRYDRATQATDTIAHVRVPKSNAQASGSAGSMRLTIGMANPFLPRDEWGVTPDGRVAVFRSPEYRVDWYGTGARTSSAPIPYNKIAVSERHKQQWRDSRRNQTTMMVTMNNGQRSVRTGPPPAEVPEPTDWPAQLPPFLDNAIFPAPNGTLWVSRTREANDDTPNFDVIDASGRVTMRVELPKGTRLMGVGKNAVYTIRTDEDDLQYLQRYRLP